MRTSRIALALITVSLVAACNDGAGPTAPRSGKLYSESSPTFVAGSQSISTDTMQVSSADTSTAERGTHLIGSGN